LLDSLLQEISITMGMQKKPLDEDFVTVTVRSESDRMMKVGGDIFVDYNVILLPSLGAG